MGVHYNEAARHNNAEPECGARAVLWDTKRLPLQPACNNTRSRRLFHPYSQLSRNSSWNRLLSEVLFLGAGRLADPEWAKRTLAILGLVAQR